MLPIGCSRRIRLGWVSCSLFPYIKSIPTHEKIFAVVKSGPKVTFNLILLGLGWLWVGEFVSFKIVFIYMFSNKIEFGKSQTPQYHSCYAVYTVVVSDCIRYQTVYGIRQYTVSDCIRYQTVYVRYRTVYGIRQYTVSDCIRYQTVYGIGL